MDWLPDDALENLIAGEDTDESSKEEFGAQIKFRLSEADKECESAVHLRHHFCAKFLLLRDRKIFGFFCSAVLFVKFERISGEDLSWLDSDDEEERSAGGLFDMKYSDLQLDASAAAAGAPGATGGAAHDARWLRNQVGHSSYPTPFLAQLDRYKNRSTTVPVDSGLTQK